MNCIPIKPLVRLCGQRFYFANRKVSTVLHHFQEHRIHIAIVEDDNNYVGLITLQDILIIFCQKLRKNAAAKEVSA